MTKRKPCPYCGTPFGKVAQLVGCTNMTGCAFRPTMPNLFADEIDIDKWWDDVQLTAAHTGKQYNREMDTLITMREKQAGFPDEEDKKDVPPTKVP